MVLNGYTINFFSYAGPLLLVTGFILIRFDAPRYKKQKMRKEQKVSQFLGWTNVMIGALTYVLKGLLL